MPEHPPRRPRRVFRPFHIRLPGGLLIKAWLTDHEQGLVLCMVGAALAVYTLGLLR